MEEGEMNDEEHDMYIAQLKEVFDSCDLSGTQLLDRRELRLLCDKLQLEDQSEYLVSELLKDKEEVDFDEFKESFVTILCRTYAKVPTTDEDDVEASSDEESVTDDDGDVWEQGGQDDADDADVVIHIDDDRESEDHKEESDDDNEPSLEREVSPKFVVGKKQYGRRSMPFTLEDFECQAEDEDDIDVQSSTKSLKHSLTGSDVIDTDEDGSESHKKRRRRDGRDSPSDDDGTETFEAEGQLNLMMADLENLTDEETYLRDIWNNLGVGRNGYINIDELARVCSHIGMDEMSHHQLEQLFDKLDADGDGHVSFREFLNEMFQHNTPSPVKKPGTPRSVGTTPTRALSAQKKIKFPGGEDRTTPSIVQGAGVTGLFSVLDPDRTGFAQPDAITDLWEKCNVTNGADVLLGLGFDLNSKVNLIELSAALEQELLATDEQNLTFLVATASYQQELRHLKSSQEQAAWAKDKLKLDLSEANARNNLLAKEVDERHANMEKSSESKLLAIEKKYQDQIKLLQTEIDKERENLAAFAARSKQNVDSEMEGLKQEEARLREQLILTQKETKKQGRDLEEVTGHLDESEKHNQRLQRELENMAGLHRKLAEYESKGILSPEEQKFTRDKMQRLEHENKELKDQNDEITAELETMKQQATPTRTQGGGVMAEGDVHTPIRKDGSVLSRYFKPAVEKNTSFSSVENSDDEGQTKMSTKTSYDDDNISVGSSAASANKKDKETIDQLRRDLQETKDHYDIDRKEIEAACRLEIAAVEDKHDEEKGVLLKHIENEKEKLHEEYEHLQQQALAELARELQTSFVHEKDNLVQKYESEKNHIEHIHRQEKEQVSERLESEFEDHVKQQLDELKTKYDQERFHLEEALAETEPYIKDMETQKLQLEQKIHNLKEENDKNVKKHKSEMDDLVSRHSEKFEVLEKQKRELELKMKRDGGEAEIGFRKDKLELSNTIDKQALDIRELHKQRAELELELKQQKEELELSFHQEKQEINDLYQERIRQLEDQIKQAGKHSVNLLEGGVAGLRGKTRDDFNQLLDQAKEEALQLELTTMIEGFHKQQLQLEAEVDMRKSELSHVFEKDKTELVDRYEAQIRDLHNDLDLLKDKMEEEREAQAERFQLEEEALEEQLAQQIREELEDEFCQQMEEIKEAYDDERREFEARAKLLQDEIEDLKGALDKEGHNRRKMEELKKGNNKLQHDKRQAERGQKELKEALEQTKQALEGRIDELMMEKEEQITAVKTEYVQSARQSGVEKAAHESLLVKNETLERQVSQLTQEVTELQGKVDTVGQLQKQIETLSQEKESLVSQLRNIEPSIGPSVIPSVIPDHAQRAINELTQEKSELEERFVDTQARLQDAEEMAKKYTHLQFDYGQMSIGQCALEESLLDTQDKLANCEATLTQAERELRDAMRYRDKYKLLKKKYEDVCKERDKVSSFAKSMKEELNKANVAQKDDHEDKGRLTIVLDEKKQIELQLQKVSDKLLEATTNFAVSQSQHISQLQQWKEQRSNMVDIQKYTKLQIDLVDNQRSVRDLQEVLKNKDDLASKLFKETSDNHAVEVSTLEKRKVSLERHLKTLQEILDGQIDKFKDQFEASEKRNLLVVDLYKENAELMESLYKVEVQKKDAVSRCYKLEDQCNQLRKLLQRVAKVAIT